MQRQTPQNDTHHRQNRTPWFRLPWATLLLALLVFTACGQNGTSSSEAESVSSVETSTTAASSEAEVISSEEPIAVSSEESTDPLTIASSETSEASSSAQPSAPIEASSEEPVEEPIENPLASYTPIPLPTVVGTLGAPENTEILEAVNAYLQAEGSLQLTLRTYVDATTSVQGEAYPRAMMTTEQHLKHDANGNVHSKSTVTSLAESNDPAVADDTMRIDMDSYYMKGEDGIYTSYAYDEQTNNWYSAEQLGTDNPFADMVQLENLHMAPYLQTTSPFMIEGYPSPVVALVGAVPASEMRKHFDQIQLYEFETGTELDPSVYEDIDIGVVVVVDAATSAPVLIEFDLAKLQENSFNHQQNTQGAVAGEFSVSIHLYKLRYQDFNNAEMAPITLPEGASYAVPYTPVYPDDGAPEESSSVES